MFFKIDILKSTNFTIFTGKYLCWSLFFDKVAGLSLSNFIKKRLQRRCFSLNIAKLLTGFFIEYLQWLLSEITSYPSHESRSNLILNISTSMFPFRNSRPEAFCKKLLRNFAKFTEKRLCQSLFCNKVAGLRAANLLTKRLWHRCFPANFVKFLRTLFLTEHPRLLFLSFVVH